MCSSAAGGAPQGRGELRAQPQRRRTRPPADRGRRPVRLRRRGAPSHDGAAPAHRQVGAPPVVQAAPSEALT
ncbi:hypothetical protein DNK48_10005 [Streptomyces malaysiensis subsp. malaysiensis]|nr:hypothetical protein DNK48_10005 [Streptomyces malaysiensis]